MTKCIFGVAGTLHYLSKQNRRPVTRPLADVGRQTDSVQLFGSLWTVLWTSHMVCSVDTLLCRS